METCEKPIIHFKTAKVSVMRYGELIALEKRALPKLEKELNEANRLKLESYITMKSKCSKNRRGYE